MIDFRYHLVSLVAVFLALAVGIVVGTSALNGGAVHDLRSSNSKMTQDKQALQGLVGELRSQIDRRDQFVTAVAPQTVAGQLVGERVLMVTAPGASDRVVQGLLTLINQAGGTASGELRLGDDLLDPAKSAVVEDLVAKVAPAGLQLPDGTPWERAAAELAAALLARTGVARLPADATAKILGGFRGANLIDLQTPVGIAPGPDRASLVVLVTPGGDGTPASDSALPRQRIVLALARAMHDGSAGAVLAGPESAARAGGLIATLREDADLSNRVSSVDNVDSSYGEVSVILALREQAAGRSGRYGQGPGSQAAAPSLGTR